MKDTRSVYLSVNSAHRDFNSSQTSANFEYRIPSSFGATLRNIRKIKLIGGLLPNIGDPTLSTYIPSLFLEVPEFRNSNIYSNSLGTPAFSILRYNLNAIGPDQIGRAHV
jgi:hypothetical protein